MIFFYAAEDVLAYNDISTHPKLTEKTALFFNGVFGPKLNSEEVLWLAEGAENEDTPPRWINHFYDPQTGLGWTSERMGTLSPQIVKMISSIALSPEDAVSSKDWAKDQNLQERYAVYQGNRTFQRAVFSYVNGDKKEGLKSLGHILHLIQDMTVPAHTRQDTHLQAAGDPGEPFENWVHNNADYSHLDNLALSGFGCLNLDDCFLKTAKYSNENFFSEDTIFDKSYSFRFNQNYQIKGNFWYGISPNNFYLFRSEKSQNGELIKFTLKDSLIHSSYWLLLSKQAVYSGAEVMRIFFEQVQKAQKDKSILETPPPSSVFSALGTGLYTVMPKNVAIFSPYGEIAKIKDAFSQAKNFVGDAFSKISGAFSNTQSLFSGIFSSGNSRPVAVLNFSPTPGPAQIFVPTPIPTKPSPATAVPKPSPVVLPREKTVIALQSSPAPSLNIENLIIEEILPGNEKITPPAIEEKNPSQANPPAENSAPSVFESAPAGPGLGGSLESGEGIDLIPETEIIFAPAAVSTSTSALFYFKSSPEGSGFECQIDGAAPTPCASPAIYENLDEGPHSFKVWAVNKAGRDETPAEYNWNINFAPEIQMEILDYKMTQIDFTVQWTSSSTDIAYFDVESKIGSNGAWTNWISNTAENSKSFQASFDDSVYYFRARAMDAGSNPSEWVEKSVLICQKPIIINEIMYNPHPGSDSYYEYVEIHNRAPVSLDLTGWKFVSQDKKHDLEIDAFFGSGPMALEAGGFALISDKISTSTVQNIYDGYYSIPENGPLALRLNIDDASMDLANSNRKISILNSSGEEMDYIDYQSYWGANGNGKSLERINSRAIYAQSRNSWSESANEGGTPNAINGSLNETAGTIIDDRVVIAKNFIWPESGSPYFLLSNARQYPTVNSSTTLIIEPGAVLKPHGKFYYSLFIKGAIKALGSTENPIFVTSENSSPQAGDWASGFYFSPESSGSIFKNVIFEYGGSVMSWPNPKRAAVYINGANVEFSDCIFRESQTHFLELIGSNSIVKNSTFSSSTDYAIFITGSSSPRILGNIFSNQEHKGEAIHIENQASPAIGGNDISGFSKAIFVKSSYPEISANTIADNSYNGLFVDDLSVFSRDAIFKNNIVYILEGSSGHNLRIAASTTLTIEPGTILKATRGIIALEVQGRLIAQGNSSSTLITFTSIKDDSIGGDTNNDGADSLPDSEAGEWIGLEFLAGSESDLDFTRIKYAGLVHNYSGDYKDPSKILQIDPDATVNLGNVTVE